MAKRLTLKEKKFAAKYVENEGNGKQAAEETYNVSNGNSAAVIASQVLQKTGVLEEIERIMETHDITDDSMVVKAKEGMEANVVTSYRGDAEETDIPDHNTRFKWWDAMAKVKRIYPPLQVDTRSINIDLQLEKMSKKDRVDLLRGLLISEKNGENIKPSDNIKGETGDTGKSNNSNESRNSNVGNECPAS